MPELLASLNLSTPIVDRQGNATKYLSDIWLALMGRVESAPFVDVGQVVQYSAQVAAIALTALVTSASSPVYRLSHDIRIAVPAGTSSEVQVTWSWTQGAVTQTRTGVLVNGNLTTSRDDGDTVFMIRPDAGTTVNYQVSYVSVGSPVAQFEADFAAEGLG